jgi:hypothetical protein
MTRKLSLSEFTDFEAKMKGRDHALISMHSFNQQSLVCVTVRSGIKMSAKGLAFNAGIEMIMCACCPFLIQTVGVSPIYAFAFCLLSISCVFIAVSDSNNLCFTALSFGGIALATLQTLPFSLTGRHFWKGPDVGISMNAFNALLAVCMVISGLLWQVLDERPFALMGAGWAFLAAAAAFTVRIPSLQNRRSIMV